MRGRLTETQGPDGFTLVELLTVMVIIAILAGLILSISGYVNKKAALSRASSEVNALVAACEAYKADNGTYPDSLISGTGTVNYTKQQSPVPSDNLDPRQNGNSTPGSTATSYNAASLELYVLLTGDWKNALSASSAAVTGSTNYLPNIRTDMLGRSNPTVPVDPSTNPITYLSDPFGNCYGYSTIGNFMQACAAQGAQIPPGTSYGYNTTFDLWSTGGSTASGGSGSQFGSGQPGDPQLQWIKNW